MIYAAKVFVPTLAWVIVFILTKVILTLLLNYNVKITPGKAGLMSQAV